MSEEQTLRDVRLAKLARMRKLGHDPYRVEKFKRTHTAQEMLEEFEDNQPVSFAGRIVSHRTMGKAGFAHISDGDSKIQGYFRSDALGEPGWELYGLLDIGDHVAVTGHLFLTKTREKSIHVETLVPLSKCLHNLPIGKEKDGHVFYGLTDIDQRYRHRHLDLISNAAVRKSLIARMKITRAVRHYLDGQGFLEVETPVLQNVAGGATARPFVTHFNAYELDVKLRISLELYLKRLICGDMPKVYEIGRVFRNEGVSQKHNPDFTMLEFYEAYADMEAMMLRVEECFAFVANEVYSSPIVGVPRISFTPDRHVRKSIDYRRIMGGAIESFEEAPTSIDSTQRRALNIGEEWAAFPNLRFRLQSGSADVVTEADEYPYLRAHDSAVLESSRGEQVTLEAGLHLFLIKGRFPDITHLDFSKPWRRVSLLEEIERHTGLTTKDLSCLELAHKALGHREVVNPSTGKRIVADAESNLGGLIEKLLEVFVEPTLIEPTFVVGYPVETSPLAKKDPENPRMTRRFEGYMLGKEICNAFSEINDPIDQRERFEQQVAERAKGDDEAHPMDEEFLYALECGMPPTGGCGIGIDRMAMMLTGSDHIREVTLFPFMKPNPTSD